MPTDQILSSFPPANAEGAFGDRLPQIVLKRRTLPWERNPAGAATVVADAVARARRRRRGRGASCPTADAGRAVRHRRARRCSTPTDKDVEQGLYLAVTETVVKKIFPCAGGPAAARPRARGRRQRHRAGQRRRRRLARRRARQPAAGVRRRRRQAGALHGLPGQPRGPARRAAAADAAGRLLRVRAGAGLDACSPTIAAVGADHARRWAASTSATAAAAASSCSGAAAPGAAAALAAARPRRQPRAIGAALDGAASDGRSRRRRAVGAATDRGGRRGGRATRTPSASCATRWPRASACRSSCIAAREGAALPGARALVVHDQRGRDVRDADAGPRRRPARHRARSRAAGRRRRRRPAAPRSSRPGTSASATARAAATPARAWYRGPLVPHPDRRATSRRRRPAAASPTPPTSCAASCPTAARTSSSPPRSRSAACSALSQLSVVSALLRFRARAVRRRPGARDPRPSVIAVRRCPSCVDERIDLGRFVAVAGAGRAGDASPTRRSGRAGRSPTRAGRSTFAATSTRSSPRASASTSTASASAASTVGMRRRRWRRPTCRWPAAGSGADSTSAPSPALRRGARRPSCERTPGVAAPPSSARSAAAARRPGGARPAGPRRARRPDRRALRRTPTTTRRRTSHDEPSARRRAADRGTRSPSAQNYADARHRPRPRRRRPRRARRAAPLPRPGCACCTACRSATSCPTPTLLPVESIRFFYIDRAWTDALVQGALSVGTITHRRPRAARGGVPAHPRRGRRRRAHDPAARAARSCSQAPAARSPASCCARARCPGWPNLHVRAYSARRARRRRARRTEAESQPEPDEGAADGAARPGRAARAVRRRARGGAHRGAAPGHPVRRPPRPRGPAGAAPGEGQAARRDTGDPVPPEDDFTLDQLGRRARSGPARRA